MRTCLVFSSFLSSLLVEIGVTAVTTPLVSRLAISYNPKQCSFSKLDLNTRRSLSINCSVKLLLRWALVLARLAKGKTRPKTTEIFCTGPRKNTLEFVTQKVKHLGASTECHSLARRAEPERISRLDGFARRLWRISQSVQLCRVHVAEIRAARAGHRSLGALSRSRRR